MKNCKTCGEPVTSVALKRKRLCNSCNDQEILNKEAEETNHAGRPVGSIVVGEESS